MLPMPIADLYAISDELAESGRPMITIEENALAGGFGAAVAELLEEADGWTKCPLLRIGLPDRFQPHGTRAQLLEAVGLDREGLKKKILGFLKSRNG